MSLEDLKAKWAKLEESFAKADPLHGGAKVKGSDQGASEAAKNTKDSNIVVSKPKSEKIDSPVKGTSSSGSGEADKEFTGNKNSVGNDGNKAKEGAEGGVLGRRGASVGREATAPRGGASGGGGEVG